MAIYFIRHAQTLGNLQNVWVGRKDEDITSNGATELNSTINTISHIKFHKIYSSPLKRAIQTSEIIKAKLKHTPNIQIIENLQERDFGLFEGKLKTDTNRIQLENSIHTESMQTVADRIKPFFEHIERINDDCLVVSHSAIFRCLVQLLGYSSEPNRDNLKNSEYVRLLRR